MSTQPPSKRSVARKNRKNDPTSGLLKEVLETVSLPTLEGYERDIVPEDLVYIGSYNWVDSPKPTIIVPGQWGVAPRPYRPHHNFNRVFVALRYREPENMGRQADAHEGPPR